MLKTKSVRSAIDRGDGLRLLIARFRGRGLPKDRYDVWMPNLGPSEKLLREFLGGRVTWPDYVRRYRKQILANAEIDRENRTIKNHGQKFTLRLIKELASRQNVTLLCHCAEDEQHCHRHVLRGLIEKI